MPRRARLVVEGEGGIEVDYAAAFLTDLRHAYNSVLAFELVMSRYDRTSGIRRFDAFADFDGFPMPLIYRRGLQIPREWPPSPDVIAALVPTGELLILSAVQIASPGLWAFLGALNPLEVLRRYLNDRHERRKDRTYRESAEERRLSLENLQREVDVIASGLRLAREFGATDRELAPIVNALINRPLTALNRHQDRDVIGAARITTEGSDRA
jgi:hypothetical protein